MGGVALGGVPLDSHDFSNPFESTILLRVFVDALGLSVVVLGFSEQNCFSDRFYQISRKNLLKVGSLEVKVLW